MSSKVQHPDGTPKAFELAEHDSFLLTDERLPPLPACLPDDAQVSRHDLYRR